MLYVLSRFCKGALQMCIQRPDTLLPLDICQVSIDHQRRMDVCMPRYFLGDLHIYARLMAHRYKGMPELVG